MAAIRDVGLAALQASAALQEQQREAGRPYGPAQSSEQRLALLQWVLAVLPAASALLTCKPAVQHGLTHLVLDSAAGTINLVVRLLHGSADTSLAAAVDFLQAWAGPQARSLALSARLLPQPGKVSLGTPGRQHGLASKRPHPTCKCLAAVSQPLCSRRAATGMGMYALLSFRGCRTGHPDFSYWSWAQLLQLVSDLAGSPALAPEVSASLAADGPGGKPGTQFRVALLPFLATWHGRGRRQQHRRQPATRRSGALLYRVLAAVSRHSAAGQPGTFPAAGAGPRAACAPRTAARRRGAVPPLPSTLACKMHCHACISLHPPPAAQLGVRCSSPHPYTLECMPMPMLCMHACPI